MKKTKTYVFDLDGTLCTLTDGDYNKAKPLQKRIDFVNSLYDQGATIKIYTARGMGRNHDDVEAAWEDFEAVTLNQLVRWKVKFHKLLLGKPSGDIYVDDKGEQADGFFYDA